MKAALGTTCILKGNFFKNLRVRIYQMRLFDWKAFSELCCVLWCGSSELFVSVASSLLALLVLDDRKHKRGKPSCCCCLFTATFPYCACTRCCLCLGLFSLVLLNSFDFFFLHYLCIQEALLVRNLICFLPIPFNNTAFILLLFVHI